VIWNLLANAVKFTPRGGFVTVDAHRAGDVVELIIADSGPGIDPAFLPHVFERFRQAVGGPTREHGGLGIGLSIVRQLVEMHGGTVSVRNNAPAPGASFTVRLPIAVEDSSGG
jgi:signal transduction histidine kinase